MLLLRFKQPEYGLPPVLLPLLYACELGVADMRAFASTLIGLTIYVVASNLPGQPIAGAAIDSLRRVPETFLLCWWASGIPLTFTRSSTSQTMTSLRSCLYVSLALAATAHSIPQYVTGESFDYNAPDIQETGKSVHPNESPFSHFACFLCNIRY